MLAATLVVSLFGIALSSEGVAPRVPLSDGHSIPQLGLGTWLGFSGTGSRLTPSGDEVTKSVEWAIDAGYRHIDTAHIYDTEDQVGRGVANKIKEGVVTREELFITTKLWNDKHERDQVVPALRDSLQHLNLDYIDLYLIHWPIAEYPNTTFSDTDYLGTWEGMVEAKKLGLTKSIGISNFNEKQIERLLNNTEEKPSVLQVEINLNLQQPKLLEYCKQKGIVVTGYTPFGSLVPTKAKPDSPPPRIDDPTLTRIAAAHNKTVPQIALRYLIELGVVPLPKSLTKSRIEQNINLFDFKLSEEEKNSLKDFDKNFRIIDESYKKDSIYYPF